MSDKARNPPHAPPLPSPDDPHAQSSAQYQQAWQQYYQHTQPPYTNQHQYYNSSYYQQHYPHMYPTQPYQQPAATAPSGSAAPHHTTPASSQQQQHNKRPAYIKVNPPISLHIPRTKNTTTTTKPSSKTNTTTTTTTPPAVENWPPSLKAYVERSFKMAPFRQRPKLQEVLRVVISDAQRNGELWTRSWDKLPSPDLTQSADTAASIVLATAAAWRQRDRKNGGGSGGNVKEESVKKPPHISASALAMVSKQATTNKKNTTTVLPSSSSRRVADTTTDTASLSNKKRKAEMPRYTFSDSDDSLIDYDMKKKKKKRKTNADEHSNSSSSSDSDDEYYRSITTKRTTTNKKSRDRDDDDGAYTTTKNTLTSSHYHTQQKSTSQGGPLSMDEEQRRKNRSNRFKDGKAVGAAPGSLDQRAMEQAMRKAKITSELEQKNKYKNNSNVANITKASSLSSSHHQQRTNRRHRIAFSYSSNNNDDAHNNDDDDDDDDKVIDWDKFAIKGTCQKLEKSYFRLTSAPDPSTVRPPHILEKALQRLIDLLADGQVNYFYAQDQFKGLRQDCVVQALKGDLTRRVYEAHARAALEYGDDIAEYNQCQGQLKVLYAENHNNTNGNNKKQVSSSSSINSSSINGSSESEFLAYRILYQSVHGRLGEALPLLHTLRHTATLYPTNNMSGVVVQQHDGSTTTTTINNNNKQGSKKKTTSTTTTTTNTTTSSIMPYEIAHALQVRRALAIQDNVAFFKLYQSAPNMGRALMDLAIPSLRFTALNMYVKAFKPSLPIEFIARSLGFIITTTTTSNSGDGSGDNNKKKKDTKGQAHTTTTMNNNNTNTNSTTMNNNNTNTNSTTNRPLPGCSVAVFKGEYAPQTNLQQGIDECIEWLMECHAVVDMNEMVLDCKGSMGRLQVPEEKDAVAHGDANLDIGDFLKSFN